MTNGEKYKSIDDRVYAFRRYCAKTECPNCCINPYKGAKHITCLDKCILKWLALDAEEKLLPCPFCGGEAEVSEGYSGMPKGTFVQCKNCWAFVAGFKTKTDAISAWNRRVK